MHQLGRRLVERAKARDLVVGSEDRRWLKRDSSITAERARCLRGISISERYCQSGRADEAAMFDTNSSRITGGAGGHLSSPSIREAAWRDELRNAAGAWTEALRRPSPPLLQDRDAFPG